MFHLPVIRKKKVRQHLNSVYLGHIVPHCGTTIVRLVIEGIANSGYIK